MFFNPHAAIAVVMMFLQTANPSSFPIQEKEEFQKPEGYRERMAREGDLLELSMTGALERALKNNLDITLEIYNQEIARQRVIGAEGFYDPVFSLGGTFNSSKNPVTAGIKGDRIPSEVSETSNFAPSLRQNFTNGGSAALSLNNNRSFTSNAGSLINPLFGSTFALSVTQPLLRGFRQTSIERQIKILNLDSRISYVQFHLRVVQVVQQVQNQYWELVFALENFETRRKSKELAIIQYESTAERVQSGLLTPAALTSARAEVAGRDRDLLQAEVQIINAQNQLKQLLAADPSEPIWETTIIPAERPQPKTTSLTYEQALKTALDRRPELEQLRLQTSQNDVDRTFYTKEKKPQANLTASLGSSGRAGYTFQRSSTDATQRILDTSSPAFGGLTNTLRQAFGFDFANWGLGLNVQIPIRNRTADAQLDQISTATRRLNTQLKKTQQGVMAEVRNAHQIIVTQSKSVEAARLARELSEQQLEAQTARFEAGLASYFEVLRYQRDLVDAQVRELRAIVDLQLATISLQKAMDVLLDENGIVLPPPKY